jgi:hypothetical protein
MRKSLPYVSYSMMKPIEVLRQTSRKNKLFEIMRSIKSPD